MRRFHALTFMGYLLLLLSGKQLHAQQWVEWSYTRLSPADFRGTRDMMPVEDRHGRHSSTILQGFIHSGISIDMEQNGDELTFVVKARMDPALSWLMDPADASTLMHEQGHFDLTELHVRELRSALKSARSFNEAKQMYKRQMKALAKEQAQYDRDNRDEAGVSDEWREKLRQRFEETNSLDGEVVKSRFKQR